MKRKILSLILVLSMVTGMAFFSKAKVSAEGNELNPDTKIIIEAYNGENKPGESGGADVHISMQSTSGDQLNLANYSLIVERLTVDSDIILYDTDLSGILKNEKTIYTTVVYEIPENLKSNSLKYKVKLVEKNNIENVLAVSNEAGIYPYEINNGVLKYYDSTMGEKYLMTVDADDNVLYWDIPPGYTSTSVVNNNIIDYYMDPKNPTLVNFSTKPYCQVEKVEVIPANAGTATVTDNESGENYMIQLTAPATVKATTLSATQAKKWNDIPILFVAYLEFAGRIRGDGVNDRFFTETALPEDIAVGTIMYLYGWDEIEYNSDGVAEVDYEKFVNLASRYFNNVPSLKNVNIENVMYYDQERDKMVFSFFSNNIYNPSLTTQTVDVINLGQERYAIHFKLSKDDIENSNPDMEDINDYTECTLVIENNGYDEWKYVSFEKGFTHSSEGVPEVPNPEPGDQPETDDLTVVEQIQQAPAGSSVNVEMKDTTVVDKDILTAAKGKDVDVVLEMDGYSWIINGKDIDEVKNVDLKVILDTKNIPEEKISALAGDKQTKQLTLAYDGEFGFTAQLNINVGKDYAKQYGNLYWYNKDKLTFIDAGMVDENGNLSLTFTHASDYVIVFDKEAHDKKAESSTKTGDATTMMVYAVPMVLSVLGLLLLKKRYNN